MNFLADALKCTICGDFLDIDPDITIAEYLDLLDTTHETLNDKIDTIIGKYLVYKCVSCGFIHKYTLKDVERLYRKYLSDKLMSLLIDGEIKKLPGLGDKYFIFCNKCKGFDGQGSCPVSMFKDCPMKRFPINEL